MVLRAISPGFVFYSNAGLPGTTDHLLLTKIYFGKYADKTRTYVSFFLVVVVLICFVLLLA